MARPKKTEEQKLLEAAAKREKKPYMSSEKQLANLQKITKTEAREKGRRGGKKSAEVRKAKKAMLEAFDEQIRHVMLHKDKEDELSAYERMLLNICAKAADADSWAVNFVGSIFRKLEFKEATDKKRAAIWRKLIGGKISEKEASYLFNQAGIDLPESVKLQIIKQDAEPEDPSRGQFSTISDEEMEELVAARESELAEQQATLPERREQMDELHQSVKDTYASSNLPTRTDAKAE